MVKGIRLKDFKFGELFYFNSLSLCPQLCMFGLQLGFLSTYLSEPIVKAFTSAAAFHVTVSQLQSMLGLRLPRHTGTFSLFKVSMLTLGGSHLTITKGSLWYCPDFRVRCGEPASHQHGGAADLFGVFGRPGASQGNQPSFPEAPAHTHPRGDPHSQSAHFSLHLIPSVVTARIKVLECFVCQVIIATGVTFAASLDTNYNIEIVGHIPAG